MADSYKQLLDQSAVAAEFATVRNVVVDDDKSQDVIVPVAMTILAKWIEDEGDGKLFLVGTLIQRVLSDKVENFEIRINEAAVPDGAIEVRRSRPVSVIGTPPVDLPNSAELQGGSARTCNIRLPLMVTEVDCVSYPFKLVEAVLKFEYSTTAIDGIQYRPTILEPTDLTQLREFYALKHHKKKGKHPKDANPEDTYHEEAFDRSPSFDAVSPVPQMKFSKEKKGKIIYFPKCDFQWFLAASYTKPLLSTVLPVVVLLVLQWLNWHLILNQNDDTSTYLTNAITIILALVVVVPNMSDKTVRFRNNMSSVDFMILFFFMGTGLSAYPSLYIALTGLLITSMSLLFPLYAAVKYVSVMKDLRHAALPVKYCLPLPGDKARGEEVNWDRTSLRVEASDNWIDPE
eukprot:TRINITY_DN2555_c0_g1_i1.p1 TRINITY_DN2555_c0_g1~~TRINITY_DN2555_c0_g1_i1.p1  ORF type:complete len:402 (+),score=120.38 TRINITY_DN2555_c0_g1_i1:71-1276(+)